MNDKQIQILLTNDDSIHSPGLWAAAEALDPLGFVHVVAPRDQQTSAGRSMPSRSTGVIEELSLTVKNKRWPVYAVDGSPGQSVLHGIYDVIDGLPDLVVSGINYGENVGSGVTISGTVGAAIEAATLGIPALAVSLQTQREHHLSLSQDIDFSAAGYFTGLIAAKVLRRQFPEDVDVIKIDVPENATPQTEWVLTHQSRQRYYVPKPGSRKEMSDHAPIGYDISYNPADIEVGSDLYALLIEKKVSVTPISIDMTSRTPFEKIETFLSGK